MPTLKQIVDDIYATVNLNSDDNNLDERQLKWWIKNKRATLIKQRLDRGTLNKTNYTQAIPCVELELVDRSLTDCCTGLAVGCKVLRSTIVIPDTVATKNKEYLMVRPVDIIQNKFSFVSHDAWINSGNGRYNKDFIFATIKEVNDGRYLYVKSNSSNLQNKLGKYLYIEGIFDDPEELRSINDCSGTSCYSDEEEFPIEQWMVDIIKQEIISKDLNILLRTPEDKENDGEANSTQENLQKR
jgi:hypothetical protein